VSASLDDEIDPLEMNLRHVLIDDLQELVLSRDSVGSLLYLLDSFDHMRPRIIVSSTVPPGRLKMRTARGLLRRLYEGLIIMLSPLDGETRKSIISNEITRMDMTLNSGVLSLLSDLPFRNFSQVRGVLLKIKMKAPDGAHLEEKFIVRILSQMIARGEIDLPLGYSLPEVLLGEQSKGTTRKTSPPAETSPGIFEATTPLEPQQKKSDNDHFDQLEKKFSEISDKIESEMNNLSSKKEQQPSQESSSVESDESADSDFIEEWDREAERLIEED
jgi:hypothetical protein